MDNKQLIRDIKGITSVVDFYEFKDRIIEALEDRPKKVKEREEE